MAGGWSRDGAVQDQIDQSVADAVEHARLAMAGGVSRADCEDCGEPIPEARRQAVAGVRTRWSKADSAALAPSPLATMICL